MESHYVLFSPMNGISHFSLFVLPFFIYDKSSKWASSWEVQFTDKSKMVVDGIIDIPFRSYKNQFSDISKKSCDFLKEGWNDEI